MRSWRIERLQEAGEVMACERPDIGTAVVGVRRERVSLTNDKSGGLGALGRMP